MRRRLLPGHDRQLALSHWAMLRVGPLWPTYLVLAWCQQQDGGLARPDAERWALETVMCGKDST